MVYDSYDNPGSWGSYTGAFSDGRPNSYSDIRSGCGVDSYYDIYSNYNSYTSARRYFYPNAVTDANANAGANWRRYPDIECGVSQSIFDGQ